MVDNADMPWFGICEHHIFLKAIHLECDFKSSFLSYLFTFNSFAAIIPDLFQKSQVSVIEISNWFDRSCVDNGKEVPKDNML